MNDPVGTLIGFALRARTLALGCDNILRDRSVCLVLIRDTLSENAVGKLKRFCENGGIALVQTSRDALGSLGTACKAVGFSDRNMAKEILKHIDTDCQILIGGINLG